MSIFQVYQLPGSGFFWIGGRTEVDEGYKWIDETGLGYVNWAKGEPNEPSGNPP